MTPAPLPRWATLLRASIPTSTDPHQLAAPWMRDESASAGWLSKSAWSLALIAYWRQQCQDGRPPRVWIPDYFCNGSLAALRQLPVELHFYPVQPDLRPDYKAARQRAKDAPPDIFLLVHYFGQPLPTADAREFCKHSGAWLVEDAAHVLQPVAGIGAEGDFVLYSPHKLLALPHGSLLIARAGGASKLGEDGLARLGAPASWSHQAGIAIGQARATGASLQTLVWCAKRSLQKLGLRPRPAPLSFDDDPGAATLPAPAMSRFAQRLLGLSLRDLPKASAWRKQNLLVLDELINGSAGNTLELAWRNAPSSATPYMASYRTADPQAELTQLRARGLHASTWPDLPPEVLASQEQHATALALRASHLFLPVHQSLPRCELIACLDSPTTSASAPASIELREVDSQASWNTMLQAVPASNLLQSWSYGQSKRATSGWQVQRLEMHIGGKTIAMVQLMTRRLAGCLTISRINRGPLFLPGTSPEIELACLDKLGRALGRWSRARVLSWAPERLLTGRHLVQLGRSCFRLLSPCGWSSSMIDLRQDEAQLRSGLSGSWRNMLNVAQRNALLVKESREDAVFERLLANCQKLMTDRGMVFPDTLYRTLWKQLREDATPGLLLVVSDGDELLAATWAVTHGRSATYLLGWSGERGRKLHAHHILLWETMLRLKADGLHWFDSGGIDDERTGGIAAFKLGLGGERYNLAGEGWCR
ncbi:lipid II:glycine glycyltransferase FemX [Herbaspirillum seropedicae]|uniref:lipid II:glycine glycyltransferase FemX n=2 Tax=Herbaspirillum seropedicae TaxID=964 RepID=UPI002858EE39|nr:hypothetical protein [Herbaspirillum seropedicae]